MTLELLEIIKNIFCIKIFVLSTTKYVVYWQKCTYMNQWCVILKPALKYCHSQMAHLKKRLQTRTSYRFSAFWHYISVVYSSTYLILACLSSSAVRSFCVIVLWSIHSVHTALVIFSLHKPCSIYHWGIEISVEEAKWRDTKKQTKKERLSINYVGHKVKPSS